MGGCHLWAAPLLTALVLLVCYHGNEAMSTVQDIKEVESIMNDLEYIETVENAQGGKGKENSHCPFSATILSIYHITTLVSSVI